MVDRILIVDDEENIRRSFEITLGGAGFRVEGYGAGEDALAAIAVEAPDAMFLDIKLPGIDGLEVLRRVRESHPQVPVIMISGHATIERAVEATRLGAFDFVEKPFGRDRILVLARNATEAGRLKREVDRLRAGDVGDILGDSPAVRELRDTIARVAPTDTRVLILGESGTGKELVARALHEGGPRAKKPFIRVNCAAIPEELIEAELFGAEKGAYTGATSAREGRFAAANGGTLFLDEIADMSLKAQAKVLRVLQEGEYEPVGSTRTRSVDVRVLAATHQDLAGRVKEGRFREDLLFRLNVIPLMVPPLRERPGDVRALGEHFLASYAERHELPPPRLHEAAWKALEQHAWPGNIRELKNVLERLVILGRGDEITSGAQLARITGVVAPAPLSAPAPSAAADPSAAGAAASGEAAAPAYGHLPLREARDALERDLIRAALARHDGNVTRAAAELGLERTHLHKRIRTLGLGEDGS